MLPAMQIPKDILLEEKAELSLRLHLSGLGIKALNEDLPTMNLS